MLYIGLMSGTSLDGVDGVLADFDGPAPCRVLMHASADFPPALRAELLALCAPGGADELHRAQLAANALAHCQAQVVQQLLQKSGIPPGQVAAIGAHGQTLRHHPQRFDGTGYSLQLNQPALLAELCGIAVVADLRSRDVAAGGQGAPLVPAFHHSAFARPGHTVVVLNIGGISNLSVLHGDGRVLGFDCGPGNVLMDAWCQQHRAQPFDRDGRWAASGRVRTDVLGRMLDEPFFAAAPPKSTGRELFCAAWLHARLPPDAAAADVQATLAELTARCCAEAARRFAPQAHELLVCGGGALNAYLMQRLRALLPRVAVQSSAARGLPPKQVEAAAFAWLARQHLLGQSGNLPEVTGARAPRVLGALHPA